MRQLFADWRAQVLAGGLRVVRRLDGRGPDSLAEVWADGGLCEQVFSPVVGCFFQTEAQVPLFEAL
ncbi:MAG: hypothetical protein VKN56_10970 [Cyanobacteriota bacterium]|nr:hypothetical protein [Cyanobacteriota bacterium]